MKQDTRYDIFISYRRNGGEYTAKVLRDRLDELGYKVFFDVESLRSGDFNTRLYSVIDECNDFIVILSPNALDRCVSPDDWVRQEIQHALEKEKNIVPILLRDFQFPQEMPPSIEPLRYKSGIPANTEFFEAFIQKLLSFLTTKPPKQSSKRVKRGIAAALLVCVLLACGVGLSRFFTDSAAGPLYPQTQVEKNLTAEYIFYLQTCLTNYDLMAGAISDALESSSRYLSSGTTDMTSLDSQFEVSQNTMSRIDTSLFVPAYGMVDRLSDSPFALNELRAMQIAMENFHSNWIDNLDYLQGVVEGRSAYSSMSKADRLQIVECYQTMLTEDAKFTGYSFNEMLLPVTNDDAIYDFKYQILPQYVYIPLSATTWSDDITALQSAESETLTKRENALKKLIALVGDTNMEINALKAQLEDIPRDTAYTRPVPTEETGIDELWDMLRRCNAHDDIDGALGCLARMFDLLENEGSDYLVPVVAFVKSIGDTTTGDGILVKSYYQPDGDNPVLEVGDIITAFNKEPCVFYEDYIDMKQNLAPGEIYTLTVLRLSAEGLQEVELTLTEDMPRVVLETLSMEE